MLRFVTCCCLHLGTFTVLLCLVAMVMMVAMVMPAVIATDIAMAATSSQSVILRTAFQHLLSLHRFEMVWRIQLLLFTCRNLPIISSTYTWGKKGDKILDSICVFWILLPTLTFPSSGLIHIPSLLQLVFLPLPPYPPPLLEVFLTCTPLCLPTPSGAVKISGSTWYNRERSNHQLKGHRDSGQTNSFQCKPQQVVPYYTIIAPTHHHMHSSCRKVHTTKNLENQTKGIAHFLSYWLFDRAPGM